MLSLKGKCVVVYVHKYKCFYISMYLFVYFYVFVCDCIDLYVLESISSYLYVFGSICRYLNAICLVSCTFVCVYKHFFVLVNWFGSFFYLKMLVTNRNSVRGANFAKEYYINLLHIRQPLSKIVGKKYAKNS